LPKRISKGDPEEITKETTCKMLGKDRIKMDLFGTWYLSRYISSGKCQKYRHHLKKNEEAMNDKQWDFYVQNCRSSSRPLF